MRSTLRVLSSLPPSRWKLDPTEGREHGWNPSQLGTFFNVVFAAVSLRAFLAPWQFLDKCSDNVLLRYTVVCGIRFQFGTKCTIEVYGPYPTITHPDANIWMPLSPQTSAPPPPQSHQPTDRPTDRPTRLHHHPSASVRPVPTALPSPRLHSEGERERGLSGLFYRRLHLSLSLSLSPPRSAGLAGKKIQTSNGDDGEIYVIQPGGPVSS